MSGGFDRRWLQLLISGPCVGGAAVAAAGRRLHRFRRTRAGTGTGGDVLQHFAWLHGSHGFRSRGVFWSWRLRRWPDAKVPRRVDAAGDADGRFTGRRAGCAVRPADRAAAGVYFAMVTVAFGQVAFYVAYSWNDFTGGYDGLRGFQPGAVEPRFHHDRHHQQQHRVLLLPAGGVRGRGWIAGVAAGVPVRANFAGDPGE